MSTFTAQHVIAEGILSTKQLLSRYTQGFDERSALAQPAGLPNHLIWNLGHLALTMHRAAEKIDGKAPPASDFVAGARGNVGAFAIESVAFGSQPAGESGGYPGLARATAIYEAACDRVAGAVRSASDAKLNEQVQWGMTSVPLFMLGLRMMFHNGFHTGQVSDTRRALKMGSVFAGMTSPPVR